MRLATRIPALLIAAALLGRCGDGGGDRAEAPPPATATATPTATATATATGTATPEGIDPLEGAGTEPVTVSATNRHTALLTGVRAARHEGYDRVVFEFSRALPGYDARYAERPIQQDGSGREVEVEGEHVVVVRMENALDADLGKEGAPATYTGPGRLRPATPVVAEVAGVGGFEGVLTWAVGLRDRVDFRVTALQAPYRLVLDFRNH